LGSNLSDKGEYADYSTHGREILDSLEIIKRSPIPPIEVFSKPTSPRPAHATLPYGWHDMEVSFVADTTQMHGNVGARDEPMFDYASMSQSQQQEPTDQTTTLDATQCTFLVLKKIEGQQYRFTPPAGKDILTRREGWTVCDILQSGEIYRGYSYTGISGTQYYTWSLELKGKKAKG
jgi:hypothetical protein